MDDGDQFIVIGSNWGGTKNPLWVANVVSNPSVRVQVGRRRMKATARVAPGEERARLWTRVTSYDRYESYAKRLGETREIPLVVLTPVAAA
jgi:deazaflavin-dependent oxidoreductase (nitroreductase family)